MSGIVAWCLAVGELIVSRRTSRQRAWSRVRTVRLNALPRPFRFALVGALCASVQLGTLWGLAHLGMDRHLANVFAGLLATQVNFALSWLFTWSDRPATGRPIVALIHRLALFNAMSLATLVVNWGVFALTAHLVPLLVAGFLGILAATGANYLISGRLVFSRRALAPLAGAPDPG